MTNLQLNAENISAGYGDSAILNQLSLDLPAGKITAIVGANACGKTTLLRVLSRLMLPTEGAVLLDGKPVHRMPPRQLAKCLGLLPQSPTAPDGITVIDLVSRGRHPHQGLFGRWNAADDEAVAEALSSTRTLDLANRVVDELSGGQRQRVWLAMVLAQQTEILLLDEPTTFLDIRHQIEVLDLLTDLNRRRNTTVVMVLHDLNLAARYADFLVAVAGRRVHACGPPVEILDAKMVRDVFGMDCHIMTDPTSNKPMMLPLGRYGVLPTQNGNVEIQTR